VNGNVKLEQASCFSQQHTYRKSDVSFRSHQTERVDEAELVDEGDEDAGGDDAEQTAEEDHHAELETPERHELLEAEQHAADRRPEGRREPRRRSRRHKVSSVSRTHMQHANYCFSLTGRAV